MTSCDKNLMKFIPIQLAAIETHLLNKKIDFYLFHDGSESVEVNKLKAIAYKNITFHDIVVKDTQLYEGIAKRGGDWCGAAYYSLCAHQYLPAKMDRILYIDAGDVLIVDDIDEYYFADFEGKSLIATSIAFKSKDDKPALFTRDDLFVKPYLDRIARGIFNSGSYVINLNKMRKIQYTLKDYNHWAELIYESCGRPQQAFFGDQGFLSLVFVDDVKFFTHSQEFDLFYMPYNFGLWYFDKCPKKLDYKPAIIHFIGDRIFKPWKGKYQTFLKNIQTQDDLHDFNELQPEQIEYYKIWYKYALTEEEVI